MRPHNKRWHELCLCTCTSTCCAPTTDEEDRGHRAETAPAPSARGEAAARPPPLRCDAYPARVPPQSRALVGDAGALGHAHPESLALRHRARVCGREASRATSARVELCGCGDHSHLQSVREQTGARAVDRRARVRGHADPEHRAHGGHEEESCSFARDTAE